MGYDPSEGFRNGRAPVVLLGRSGYIDLSGKLTIYPLSGWAHAFCGNGRAPLGRDGKPPVLIDRNGKIVFELSQAFADNLGCFSEGRIQLKYGEDTVGFSDTSGRILLWRLRSGGRFRNGLAPVQRQDADSKWWYIDRRGKFVLGPFDVAEEFSEGLAVAGTTGRLGFIDKRGRFVIPPRFFWADAFSENRAVVTEGHGKYKLIDRTGAAHSADWFTSIQRMSEGAAAASRDVGAGFIDGEGKTVVPFQFEATRPFSDGLAAARRHGLWGYIDHSFEWVIPPRFTFANAFSEGRAAVYFDDHVAFIDKRGHVIWDENVAERELLAIFEQKRQSAEKENSIPFDDPLANQTTDDLVRRLTEGDFRVIPTLALRLDPKELSSALMSLSQEEPEFASDNVELAAVPRGRAWSLALAVDESGKVHVVFGEHRPQWEAAIPRDAQTWSESMWYRQRDQFGRWLDVESIGQNVTARQASIVPLREDHLTVFSTNGVQVFRMTRNSGVWSERERLLPGTPKFIATFDTSLRADNQVDLTWSPWSPLPGEDQPISIGYGIVGEAGLKSTQQMPGVAGENLIDVAFLSCSPLSVAAVGQRRFTGAYTAHAWVRAFQSWKHFSIADDNSELVVDRSSTPRAAMLLRWLGPETEFNVFSGHEPSPLITRICFPAPELGSTDDPAAALYDGKPVVAVGKGAFIFLLRDEGGGTTALLLARAGEGRDAANPHLVIRGDRAIVTFAEFGEKAGAVSFAEVPLRGVVWTPVERLFFRAARGVGLADLDSQTIAKVLKLAAKQMEWQHHGPRALGLYAAARKYHDDGMMWNDILRLCKIHRSAPQCEGLHLPIRFEQ